MFKIVRHVQDGVGCGGLRDVEVWLSQNYTIADKGNKRLTSLSAPHWSWKYFCGILVSVPRCNYTLTSSQANGLQKCLRAKIALANFTGKISGVYLASLDSRNQRCDFRKALLGEAEGQLRGWEPRPEQDKLCLCDVI